MDYQKHYDALIQRAKNSNRVKTDDTYFESHHIIPEFMFKNRSRKGPKGHLPGNPNDSSNLVLLTTREHVLAHLLLAFSLNGKRYWAQAASSLAFFDLENIGGNHTRQKIAGLGRRYARYRPMANDAISVARTGKMPAVDAITRKVIGSVPVDHPNVISGKWVHHSKGVPISEEHKQKLSKAFSGAGNNTYINVTNEEIIKAYSWLINTTGEFVSRPFFRKWFTENYGFPPPNFTSKHRFNFGKDLLPMLETITGKKHYPGNKTVCTLKTEDYPYHDKNS